MNTPKFIIGSGYFQRPGETWQEWFFPLWLSNTRLQAKGRQIFVLATGGCVPPITDYGYQTMCLMGDLGHVHDLVGKSNTPKPYAYCGWSASVLMMAMIAYNDESDFIYKEGDCLAFGPWVEKLYEELGDRKMIFGKSQHMPCAQSLFLVKHDWIPDFVQSYLTMPTDRNIAWLGETKFIRMMERFPDAVCQFSFPFDRDRPLDYDLPVWYAQKWRPDELMLAELHGLIKVPPHMPVVKAFTGDTTDI